MLEKEEIVSPALEDLKSHYRSIITLLGEDAEREGLLKTPERVAKAMLSLTKGYHMDPHEVLRSTNIFIIVYILIIAGSVFLIAFDDFDLITNFTAVTATFNNIGPGLELVGPIGNFEMFSWFSKIVLSFDMLAGRLEIFPLLLLFVRDTWKKF